MTNKQKNMVLEKKNLPEGWVNTPLDQISEINPRKPENGTIDNALEVSFVPMKCVKELTGIVDLSFTRKYSEVRTGYTYFVDGDIIFAKITPCMENGKIAIMQQLKNGIGFGSTEFHVLRLNDQFTKKFYFHYLMQDGFRDKAQHNMKGTAGQLRVPVDYLKNVLVPLPPLNEQKRIVSKIESIFSQIDAAKVQLEALASQTKSASGSLNMLKSSVLKQAFEGKLVPQDPKDESAEILLKKIHKNSDRKLTFEKENLPEGWISTTIEKISSRIHYGYTAKSSKDKNGPKYLRITDIQNNSVNWGKVPNCEIVDEKLINFILNVNDLVFARTGATVGKSFLIKNPPKAVFASYLIRIILSKDILADYVNDFFNSYSYWNQIHSKKVGMAQPNFNATKLSKIVIPIPPLNEQKRIVTKIESIFDRIDAKQKEMEKLELQLKSIPDSIATLKSSILKLAFEGKLVPHDPDDEPASVLLEKIKSKTHKQTT